MAGMPQYLRNCNVWVDGRGFAGQFDSLTLPKLAIQTEEYRGGGMDAAVELDVGMEKLEASLSVNQYDPATFALLGLVPGNIVNITARAALDQDGEITPAVVTMNGAWKEVDFGDWKPGEKAANTFSVACRYFALSIGGTPTVEIDVPNMVRKLQGVDQLAEVRKAIGM
ncbi:hypothetical protein SAMN05660831_02106 [Thiohalospira halophila DSM 15071]|uniref:Phage major tail tube protein n=1 Tax=Thiohalospira halophila DSM 15071 TaxID=1123397 RepID=A0A1I1UKG8_9GAMM|nr:phage major tail tube protein [Thiohalospira halophila]SFD68460.1 hypothetical protein SAMN05660831_02106 [Thiohalospira halophila DSM 15071]